MHAAWTLLLARARDSETATAAALGIAVAVFAPFAAFSWDVDAAPVPYLECVLVLTVLVYLPVMARVKGARAIRAAAGPRIAAAALCIFAAYALVLGEPAGRRRLAGAAVVVAGITTLALA
jgi:drug/metabolite transporter (DMT)-like permease